MIMDVTLLHPYFMTSNGMGIVTHSFRSRVTSFPQQSPLMSHLIQTSLFIRVREIVRRIADTECPLKRSNKAQREIR